MRRILAAADVAAREADAKLRPARSDREAVLAAVGARRDVGDLGEVFALLGHGRRCIERRARGEVDSSDAWLRLLVSLALSTIGGVGMWSVVVALPTVQAEFGVARGAASLPYTLTMVCFGVASIVMGRLSDRFGIIVPVVIGTLALALGYVAAGFAGSLWFYTLAQGGLIGTGSSATFAPLLAHTSLWFDRRRGIAVAIFASGNYLAGTLWPPIVQHFIETIGWRHTYFAIGVFCAATMLPLALFLRRPPPAAGHEAKHAAATPHAMHALGLSNRALQALLVIAGLAAHWL